MTIALYIFYQFNRLPWLSYNRGIHYFFTSTHILSVRPADGVLVLRDFFPPPNRSSDGCRPSWRAQQLTYPINRVSPDAHFTWPQPLSHCMSCCPVLRHSTAQQRQIMSLLQFWRVRSGGCCPQIKISKLSTVADLVYACFLSLIVYPSAAG